MSKIKQMYHLLEEMVESAAKGDKEKVLELNISYETLVPKVYHDPRTPLDLEYENCRQSCVVSVTMFKDQHNKFVADAKERFSKISKPE